MPGLQLKRPAALWVGGDRRGLPGPRHPRQARSIASVE